ncbi:MAG: PqqD family protein [Ignavibacteria bacterium]|jgi:hypothetical protein|nr:PqqD family protein [Ignavibacteria bacterium]
MKKEHKKANLLELTPIHLLTHEYRADGEIDVLVPRFKHSVFQKILPKHRSPYIKANLDELGTATWELIDGKRNVTEIAEMMVEKYGERIEPVHQRVSAFMQQMYRNKFISFVEFSED